MKTIICFHSQTGNTEKVANAIRETLESEGEEADTCTVANMDPAGLAGCELAIVGSGIYCFTSGR